MAIHIWCPQTRENLTDPARYEVVVCICTTGTVQPETRPSVAELTVRIVMILRSRPTTISLTATEVETFMLRSRRKRRLWLPSRPVNQAASSTDMLVKVGQATSKHAEFPPDGSCASSLTRVIPVRSVTKIVSVWSPVHAGRCQRLHALKAGSIACHLLADAAQWRFMKPPGESADEPCQIHRWAWPCQTQMLAAQPRQTRECPVKAMNMMAMDVCCL